MVTDLHYWDRYQSSTTSNHDKRSNRRRYRDDLQSQQLQSKHQQIFSRKIHDLAYKMCVMVSDEQVYIKEVDKRKFISRYKQVLDYHCQQYYLMTRHVLRHRPIIILVPHNTGTIYECEPATFGSIGT